MTLHGFMNAQYHIRLFSLIFMIGFLPAFSGCVSPNRPIPVNKEASASLVVLIQHEPESQALADKLQPMLESEMSQQWQGKISVRSKSAVIPAEHEEAEAGEETDNTDGEDGSLKSGVPGHASYQLTVKVMPSNINATVTLFPAATVVHEQAYHERLDPFSLSFRIATAALKGIRQSVRDPNRPLVSIGSFTSDDPNRRFFGFCQSVDRQLRHELAKEENIELAERLFPPELLKDSELDRDGLLAYVGHRLVAPTPDILLYGEFLPRAGKKPDATNAVLDVTLYLMCPTGLCPRQEATFTCRSDKPEALVRYIVKRFKRTADLVRGRLLAGAPRGYSEEDYAVFKKRTFQMLPKSPDENGNYYIQYGGRPPWGNSKPGLYNQYDTALRQLECCLRIKWDDSQALACMGVALYEMARPNAPQKPVIESLDAASQDMLERAYRLESNWNTRGLYAYDGKSNALKVAQQIWSTRQTEPWAPYLIHCSFVRLLRSEADFRKQQDLFLDALPHYVTQRYITFRFFLQSLCQIEEPFAEHISRMNTTGPLSEAYRFSETLCANDSLFIQELGHLLGMQICARMTEVNPEDETATEFAEHFRNATSLLLKIRKATSVRAFDETPNEITSIFAKGFDVYTEFTRQYGIKDESKALKTQYEMAIQPPDDTDSDKRQATPTKLSDNTIWTNSLGMKFVPVTGVVCRFSIRETRVKDYEEFVKATRRDWPKPDFQQEPDHPAVNASWNDARAFCGWLTEKETAAGALPAGWEYRLPTDAEWSAAVDLREASGETPADKDGKVTDVYPWGNYWPPKAGDENYHGEEAKADNRPVIDDFKDGFTRTSPVGSFKANKFGLFDMGGNVSEWCEDAYKLGGGGRVLRGASWRNLYPRYLLSSFRNYGPPDVPSVSSGFRCVVAPIAHTKKKLIHRDR